MIPDASTLPKPRFFWPWLLVGVPLLVLAALAVEGLRSRWQARLGEAQEEAQRSVKRIRLAAEAALDQVWTSDLPQFAILYELAPHPPDKASEAWEAAVKSEDLAQFRALRDSSEVEWTDAGLPVAPLAAWEVFSREPSTENARDLVQRATSHPSTVSPVIMEHGLTAARAKAPDCVPIFEEGLDLWRKDEKLRDIVRRHWIVALKPGPLWVLEDGELWRLTKQSGPDGPEFSVLPMHRRLFDAVREEVRQLPPWITVSFRFQGELLRESPADPAAPQSPPPGTGPELVSETSAGPVTVRADLGNTDLLYKPVRTEIVWVSGLIGAATLAAGGGLWLSRRALLREQRLHALKSQFVASVSHELRAPIGSVRLMAEALSAGTVQGEAAQAFHRLLAEEGMRLSALIENILDFARIEAGRKAYQKSETDIEALLRDTVTLLQPRAAPRGITIRLETSPLPQVPEVDALAVQQAVINLLDNAVKFSPDNSLITVTLAGETSGAWSIRIADEGPGIPPAEHARIFERFHRLGNELRRETQGAGIGLSLVKHIAEGHNGKVTIQNLPSQGTAFTLHFPPPKPSEP